MYFKSHERFFIPNYHFHWTTSQEEKEEILLQLEKHSHNHVAPTPFKKPQGSAYRLVIVKRYLQQSTVSHQDISFRYKSLLAGDMNTKHPFWNSVVANPSGMKTTGFIVYK
jgi:hypothetical protein